MFVRLFLGEKLFDVIRARAEWISCVEDLDHHIGGVDHFVQLVPDATRLTFGKLVGCEVARGRKGGEKESQNEVR